MMGMSDMALFTSWYVTYFLIFGATAFCIAALSAKTLFPKSELPLLFIYFFLYGASSIAVCFLIRSVDVRVCVLGRRKEREGGCCTTHD